MSVEAAPPPRPRHRLVGGLCALVAIGMIGAAYASVPLYRAFCQLTGFDGTVRRGAGPIGEALDRTLTVRFDTNVRNLPWTFLPEAGTQSIKIGAPAMAWFKVRNDSDRPITGRAIYNVVPEVAGAYFIKTTCFCFNDQTIPAHTEMRFPVIYYVQPGFAEDRNTRQFQEITLSYTYFPSLGAAQAAPVPSTLARSMGPKSSEALGGGAGGAL